MKTRIMIVDNHSMIREGLKQLLELDGEFSVVEEAGDGQECLDKLWRVKPDVLLLDINMPQMDGLQVLERIREMEFPVKILMLTVHGEVDYLKKSMDMGADGYVLKDSESAELKKAIFLVLEGTSYLPENMIRMLENRRKEEAVVTSVNNELTKRELEVIKLLAVGMYNKEIAEKLHISERTVKNHVSGIFKKINVSDRTQAAVYAIKTGLVVI